MRITILISYLIISLYIGLFANDRLYFIGEQLTHVLLLSLIVTLLNKGITKAIASGALMLVSFEFIDEILGNNTISYLNDYISYLLAIIVTIHLSLKWSK